VLQTAELAIDAGVDELYYDWAIGGTAGIVAFFTDVQDLIEKKGKNLTVFGNCKGNIIADEVCDIGKSEGTEEAGVWEGRWVHNAAQAKFYYAAGDGWKPYRSKYEGADPGVPNLGAHSGIDDMKTGWQRPMAEATAFQSDFVIAEAGRRLRDGWILQNDPTAMKAWHDICAYNRFFAENEEYLTDVTTVSRIALRAPPVIPSFEASVRRVPLYNALIEENVMFDVLLLAGLHPAMLTRYPVIIIPDIPWVEESQLVALRRYEKQGGKIYALGSSAELREIATVRSPANLAHATQNAEVRDTLVRNLDSLLQHRLVTLDNADYVLANMVKKTGTDRVILHLVNYAAVVKDLEVRMDLSGTVNTIDTAGIRFYSPDGVPETLESITVNDATVEFTLPELRVYGIVVVN
jgi:hypothetical protein